MANVIYRGPVEREPETINLPVSSALNPGIAVIISAGKLTSTGTPVGRWFILGNRRFIGRAGIQRSSGSCNLQRRTGADHRNWRRVQSGRKR